MNVKLWVENSLSWSMVKTTISNFSSPLPPYVLSMLLQMLANLFFINLMSAPFK